MLVHRVIGSSPRLARDWSVMAIIWRCINRKSSPAKLSRRSLWSAEKGARPPGRSHFRSRRLWRPCSGNVGSSHTRRTKCHSSCRKRIDFDASIRRTGSGKMRRAIIKGSINSGSPEHHTQPGLARHLPLRAKLAPELDRAIQHKAHGAQGARAGRVGHAYRGRRAALQRRRQTDTTSSRFRPLRMSSPMLSATLADDALIESRARCA